MTTNDSQETTEATLPLPEHEQRNFLLIALNMIVFRVGWIFKTESVIIPAFVDTIAGAGWVRGCLPVLARLGQSIPPLYFAGPLRRAPRKHWVLAILMLAMSIPFGILSLVWFFLIERNPDGGITPPGWLPFVFLALYGLYFVIYGLGQQTFGTVQGKLIRPTRRGRLLLTYSLGSTPPACLCAYFILSRWLALPDGGFGAIFAFVAVCFFISGLVAMLLREKPDECESSDTEGHPCGEFEDGDASKSKCGPLRATWTTLRSDMNLALLLLIAALFGGQIIILPHYQALAREELGLSGTHLMTWVIIQNMSVGLFSVVVGLVADHQGYRLTLRGCLIGVALAPLFAVSMINMPGDWGVRLYPILYVFLAIIPMALRAFLNYTLEICDHDQQPRYLSTLQLGAAAPFIISPFVGRLVDLFGFTPIFISASALTFLAAGLTFGLREPRLPEPHWSDANVLADEEDSVSGFYT
jgi:hypothetical protein